ncbi:hypothetical protein MIR68_005089 [Amoeboaphelidium protococcarum]|nr:hypothetical protein MIR68_005089 [Amoeboaphelidium protococcarum]
MEMEMNVETSCQGQEDNVSVIQSIVADIVNDAVIRASAQKEDGEEIKFESVQVSVEQSEKVKSILQDLVDGIVDPLTMNEEELQNSLPFNNGLLQVIYWSLGALSMLWLVMLIAVFILSIQGSIDNAFFVMAHCAGGLLLTCSIAASLFWFQGRVTREFTTQQQLQQKVDVKPKSE